MSVEDDWSKLSKRRSRRFSQLFNKIPTEGEEKSPYSSSGHSNSLHLFSLLLTLVKAMRCRICGNLFLDVTSLNCGHVFCKFCLSSLLKSKDFCPICLNANVHPICNRCFALDSLMESLYPLILEILDTGSSHPSVTNNEAIIRQDMRNIEHQISKPQIKMWPRFIWKRKLILHSLSTVEGIRSGRRRKMVNERWNIKSCPNKSMLEGIGDLGFGLRTSATGFVLLVIGCIFLAVSVCQFSELLDKMGLHTFRRIAYVLLILYLIGTNNSIFQSVINAERKLFWEQIFKTSFTEQANSKFQNERKRILHWVQRKEIDVKLTQKIANEIVLKFKTNSRNNMQ